MKNISYFVVGFLVANLIIPIICNAIDRVYGMVEYYAEDNLLISIKDYVDLIFNKNNKYAYQKEYRFAAGSPHSLDKDRLNIDIGCIKDICKIHYKI